MPRGDKRKSWAAATTEREMLMVIGSGVEGSNKGVAGLLHFKLGEHGLASGVADIFKRDIGRTADACNGQAAEIFKCRVPSFDGGLVLFLGFGHGWERWVGGK